ncbi:MAG: hypothetical protein WAZ12_04815 [Candidatus Absconditicoccaceae bacterium]
MKTKSIILPAIMGLVVLTSAGALTFASNSQSYSGAKQGNMGMKDGGMRGGLQGMQNLSETDRQAMMDAVQKAIDAKDYNAFKAAHTKYGIILNTTETQFKDMFTKRLEMDTKRAEKNALKTKSQEAIKNGDFTTRKSLNKDMPILKYIDTQEKFTKLQEMGTYREKIQTIAKELGLPQGKGIGEGMGMGMGKGMGKGMGMGMGFGKEK